MQNLDGEPRSTRGESEPGDQEINALVGELGRVPAIELSQRFTKRVHRGRVLNYLDAQIISVA